MIDLKDVPATELFRLAGALKKERRELFHKNRERIESYKASHERLGRSLGIESEIWVAGVGHVAKGYDLKRIEAEMCERMKQEGVGFVCHPDATFGFGRIYRGSRIIACCSASDLDRLHPTQIGISKTEEELA